MTQKLVSVYWRLQSETAVQVKAEVLMLVLQKPLGSQQSDHTKK